MSACELVNIVNLLSATEDVMQKRAKKHDKKEFLQNKCARAHASSQCSQVHRDVFMPFRPISTCFITKNRQKEGFLSVLHVLMLTTMSVSRIFAMRIDIDSVNYVNLPFLKFTQCSQKKGRCKVKNFGYFGWLRRAEQTNRICRSTSDYRATADRHHEKRWGRVRNVWSPVRDGRQGCRRDEK